MRNKPLLRISIPNSTWPTQNKLIGTFGGSLSPNVKSGHFFLLYKSFTYFLMASSLEVLWDSCVCKMCVSTSLCISLALFSCLVVLSSSKLHVFVLFYYHSLGESDNKKMVIHKLSILPPLLTPTNIESCLLI